MINPIIAKALPMSIPIIPNPILNHAQKSISGKEYGIASNQIITANIWMSGIINHDSSFFITIIIIELIITKRVQNPNVGSVKYPDLVSPSALTS